MKIRKVSYVLSFCYLVDMIRIAYPHHLCLYIEFLVEFDWGVCTWVHFWYFFMRVAVHLLWILGSCFSFLSSWFSVLPFYIGNFQYLHCSWRFCRNAVEKKQLRVSAKVKAPRIFLMKTMFPLSYLRAHFWRLRLDDSSVLKLMEWHALP